MITYRNNEAVDDTKRFFEKRDHATVMSLHITHDNDKYILIVGYTHSFFVLPRL